MPCATFPVVVVTEPRGSGQRPSFSPPQHPRSPSFTIFHFRQSQPQHSRLYLIVSIVCSTPGNLSLEHMLTNGQSLSGASRPSMLRQIRCSSFLGSYLGSRSHRNWSPGNCVVCCRRTGKIGEDSSRGLQGPRQRPLTRVLLLPLLARDSLRLCQVWGRGKARIGSGFKSHLCLFLTVGLCTSHVPSLGLGQLVIK